MKSQFIKSYLQPLNRMQPFFFFSSRAGYSLSLLDLADVSLVAMYKIADMAWIPIWQITSKCQNSMWDSTSTSNLIHIFLWCDDSGQQKRLTNLKKKKKVLFGKMYFNREDMKAGLIWTLICKAQKGKSCVRNCKGRLASIFMVVVLSSAFESIK